MTSEKVMLLREKKVVVEVVVEKLSSILLDYFELPETSFPSHPATLTLLSAKTYGNVLAGILTLLF